MMTMAETEKAILAGGCFWGVQDLVRTFDGVVSTRVGYTGGDVPNATYRNHGTHAEAIEITFDLERISFRDLLEFFFQIHDPTTKNRQGNDIGLSYRSAIFYLDDEQKHVAEDTIGTLTRPDCGRARSSPRSSRRGPFGRPSPSIRTTWPPQRRALPPSFTSPAIGRLLERRGVPLMSRPRPKTSAKSGSPSCSRTVLAECSARRRSGCSCACEGLRGRGLAT
jgi:peptide-methionine (S)-S-oxide reductase